MQEQQSLNACCSETLRPGKLYVPSLRTTVLKSELQRSSLSFAVVQLNIQVTLAPVPTAAFHPILKHCRSEVGLCS